MQQVLLVNKRNRPEGINMKSHYEIYVFIGDADSAYFQRGVSHKKKKRKERKKKKRDLLKRRWSLLSAECEILRRGITTMSSAACPLG